MATARSSESTRMFVFGMAQQRGKIVKAAPVDRFSAGDSDAQAGGDESSPEVPEEPPPEPEVENPPIQEPPTEP